MAWISFGALSCRKKKISWQLASRCCWNRGRPWNASELISFLVGVRTYQHPGSYEWSPFGIDKRRGSKSNVPTVSYLPKKSDFLNESKDQLSSFWSSVSWTWDYTDQRSRRRCLDRRTPQNFFLFVITIIIRAAICLPPGGPTDNIPSTQLCCLDLLPWEQKINNWGMEFDGRRGEVWNICCNQVGASTIQVMLIN